MISWVELAKDAGGVAVDALSNVNPIAGTVAGWALDVAAEIIDDVEEKNISSDPIAAAQHVADRAVDLVELLKVMGTKS